MDVERERGGRILFLASECARLRRRVPLDSWWELAEQERERYREEWDIACAELEAEKRASIGKADEGSAQKIVDDLRSEIALLRESLDKDNQGLSDYYDSLYADVLAGFERDLDAARSECRQLRALVDKLAVRLGNLHHDVSNSDDSAIHTPEQLYEIQELLAVADSVRQAGKNREETSS
jgi:hypothetical protein